MTPLSVTEDVTFETWIENTPYTLARKDELRRIFYDSGLDYYMTVEEKFLFVKSFVKDETYPTYKHARAINSRSDIFKCLVGPIFQKISDQLFKTPWFIKKIPINERPQYILDMLYRTGHYYFISDYTSFEAHFTREMMEDCEMQLADYMTKDLPQHSWFMDLLTRAKCGTNSINFKNWGCEIEAKRMSGEMDTSLSNGFSNLMFMLYMCEQAGLKDVRGVIEGDDGLFVFKGDPSKLNNKVFADFGLSIKMERVENLNHASFCGMIFDLDERTNVTDPISELVSFGWTTGRYAKSKPGVHKCLIRAKALSLAYQYPACPILTTLAYKMAELTAGYDSMAFVESQGSAAYCLYEIEMIRKSHDYFDKNNLKREPGPKTRLLVQEMYGLLVEDQIAIENYISNLTRLEPIDHPAIGKYLASDWIDYYNRYTLPFNRRDVLDAEGLPFPQKRPPCDLTDFFKKKKQSNQTRRA